ncbi:MAG: type I-F CRISPR-associated endoribonuclease Cas6/Csy4 [Pseudomonadota bacterium]
MKYYLDITLLPDAEANLGFLWQKVYQQVHLALVENSFESDEVFINQDGKEEKIKKSNIAVSFPKYNDKEFPLGNKLRLFAPTEEILQQLGITKWLNRLTDYTHCTSIRDVPSSVEQYAYFKRKQFDTNLERLARRRAKRKNESLEQALLYYVDFKDKESKLPFINMISLSSDKDINFSQKKRFTFFIERELVKRAVGGKFTCYGLSNRKLDGQATIPWF